MLTVEVALPSRAYPIYIDADAGAEARLADAVAERMAGRSKLALVTDETVARLHGARVEGALRARGVDLATIIVPEGEPAKSLAQAERVCESLARAGLDRRALVLALGGGVVGDLAGFAAAIFLRGVDYAQLPTTLLAQVDSSVGGKTGVNLPSGKNLAGAFHQPLFVFADVTTLATLDPGELSSGLAEVLKHGAIADEELFALVEKRAEDARAGEPALLAELVARSVRIKARVVAADERETAPPEKGGRALLNFGHTVGHALEAASHETSEPLRHGEAVALGMLAAARIGAALGAGDPSLEARLQPLLARLGLPCDLERRLDAATLARVGVDKKRAGAHVRFVIVDRVGSAKLIALEPARLAGILLGEIRR